MRVHCAFVSSVLLVLCTTNRLVAQTPHIDTWMFPQQTDAAWLIGNEDAAWAVSKSTGQIVGGWNARTRSRYLVSLVGRYHLEDRQSLTTGIETDDTVLNAAFDQQQQRIELTCSNPKVPDLIIDKAYWLRDNKLFSRVSFRTRSDALQFVTYNAQARFEPAYREGGYYMGGGDGGWPLVPAPQVSSWKAVTAYRNTTKGMLLDQADQFGYSVAHIRTRLDDHFVWPWFTGAIGSYCEPVNILHYTPDGWDMSLGTSKLSQDASTSFEQYVSIFKGDWQQFLTGEYPALPEVRQAYDEIPPTPNWVGDIIADTGSDIDRLRRLLETTDEGYITVLIDFGGSWADYYVDRGLEGGVAGGSIHAEEMRALIQRLKALSPRVKVGIYMWVLSTTENTRIYREHPEWFRAANKAGDQITTFPGVATNFAHLLSIPACYKELLSQFDLVLDYLDTDFIYLDDPKAINPIDWSSGEYTRDDLSYQLMLDIKRVAASHGPDKMVFFNNMCNPYADVNYIEARGEINPNYWRHFAGNVAVAETNLNNQPDGRIVLLYFIPPYQRDYMNRVLSMGWIPELAYSNGEQLVERRAFVQAAYEIGNSTTVPVRYSPDWKRDEKTNVESYAVQRRGDDGYLLSFINHDENTTAVPVELNLESFALPRDGQVFIWHYTVEDAGEYKGVATERMARDVYDRTGWLLDHAAQRTLVYAGPYRDNVAIDLDMDRLILHQLYVTSQPAAVYAQRNLSSAYLFSRTPHVSLNVSSDWDLGEVDIAIDSRREHADVMVFVPLLQYRLDGIAVDGQTVEPQYVWDGGNVFPVVTVGQGRHELKIRFSPVQGEPIIFATLNASVDDQSLHITLPNAERAVLAIKLDGRLLYNRAVTGSGGAFTIPLSSPRKDGDYQVSLHAVIDDDGQVHTASAPPTVLHLAATTPDAAPGPIRPAMMPGTRDIRDVDRNIQGVRVLRSAAVTTESLRGTLQPQLEALMAQVDPDALRMEAGTTRKIEYRTRGAAFSGLEIENLRKVKVRLENTFYSASHMRGKGNHTPPYGNNSSPFAGIVVDYHTSDGYAKRVGLSVGVMHDPCSSTNPAYGTATVADEFHDLGKHLIETPQATFVLDLERFAPENWDGQVWLSVGSDWVASDRRLTLQILEVNDAVTGEPVASIDPRAIMDAYLKPRTLRVSRSPGGIQIDGPSNEEWWRGGAITDEFFLNRGVGRSDARTTAKLLYDDEHLFIAFVCDEPSRNKPLVQGGSIWHDDAVEVWIDANGDGKTYTQIILNAANAHVSFNERGPREIDINSGVYVDETGTWMVEMTIPYAQLGVSKPKPGEKWRISLCRGRPAGAGFNTEQIVWAPLQTDGFNDPANFGLMVFE